jgi:hypothetical protein
VQAALLRSKEVIRPAAEVLVQMSPLMEALPTRLGPVEVFSSRAQQAMVREPVDHSNSCPVRRLRERKATSYCVALSRRTLVRWMEASGHWRPTMQPEWVVQSSHLNLVLQESQASQLSLEDQALRATALEARFHCEPAMGLLWGTEAMSPFKVEQQARLIQVTEAA